MMFVVSAEVPPNSSVAFKVTVCVPGESFTSMGVPLPSRPSMLDDHSRSVPSSVFPLKSLAVPVSLNVFWRL